ncbi:MAG: hypothetical protein ACRCX2_37780 [Paraclostridium sp.]
MKKRPLDYRNDIKKCEETLHRNLEQEDYMANDLLDQALDVIAVQSRYIKWLEKEHGDWLNNR